MADFLSGKQIGGGVAMAALPVPDTETAKAAYVVPGSNEVLVIMPDGTVAKAVLTLPQTVASLN